MAVELAPRTGLIGTPLTNGLILPQNLTFDEWKGALHHADMIVESSPWWLVELMIYGEVHFGEEHTNALPTIEEDPTGASQSRMKQAGWMGSVYPTIGTRVPGLTYTHHRIAAALDPKERSAVLRQAVEAQPKPWSTRELDTRVKEIVERGRSIPAQSEPVATTCAADWAPSKSDLLPEHRAALESAALDADLDDPTGFCAGAIWAWRQAGNEAMFREDRWRD